MKIPFLKMHGLGNDMLLIGAQQTALPDGFSLSPQTIRQLADRREGVGFDQLLLVSAADDGDSLARYRIFNSDGHEVEQCGNGARCIAAALALRDSLPRGARFSLQSAGGRVQARLTDSGDVEIDMGEPRFAPGQIPLRAEQEQDYYTLALDGRQIRVAAVSMGNPHCVRFVDDVDAAPVASDGPLIGSSDYFPQGVNVGFAEVVDRSHLRLRVFERGAGETRACGTGACAAMVCAHRNGLLDTRAEISLPGGRLVIDWRGPGSHVLMTGPATLSFEGILTL